MASTSKRSLAGFNQVASISENKINKDSENASIDSSTSDIIKEDNITNTNDSTNDNTNKGVNTIASTIMNEIMAPEKPKPVYKGFYLDPDVVAVLEKVALQSGKKGSKGVQSKIVNESLRMFFKDSGLLKE